MTWVSVVDRLRLSCYIESVQNYIHLGALKKHFVTTRADTKRRGW